MKKWFLLFGLLAMVSCTKDDLSSSTPGAGTTTVGTAEGAVRGTLAVKLTPEAAEAVEATRAESRSLTRSGMELTDEVLDKIGAVGFERIIPYDALFEERHRQAGLHLWYRIYFDEATDLAAAAALLRADDAIATVEFTHDCTPVKPLPTKAALLPESPAASRADGYPMNDTRLPYQWNYMNPGAIPPFSGFSQIQSGADIDLFDAWKLCTGDPRVVVAVVDMPVQTTHPDLAANIWTNTIDAATKGTHGYNFYGNTKNLDWTSFEAPNDSHDTYEYADHGTHVAGTIAAVNNNNLGVCGIAGGTNHSDGVKIMSCQIIGYGTEASKYDTNFQALVYAADHGAVIAQNSWGYNSNVSETSFMQSSDRQGIDYFVNNAGANNALFPDAPLKGGLVVFAAGNSGGLDGDVKTWPAAYSKVVAVGATDWGFRPAYYTNYGSWIDISAPGGDGYAGVHSDGNYYSNGMVLSTMLQDPAIDFKDGRKDSSQSAWFGYGFEQGTSMACPHVSGVAALGLSYAAKLGKQYTADEFRALLLSSVYGIDSYFAGTKFSYTEEGSRFTLNLSNYVNKMGGGCVDALKMLLAVKGTPALYVQTGTTTTLDFANYLGGSGSKVSILSIAADKSSDVGLSSLPAVSGTRLTLTCPKSGMTLLTVTARAGDTTFTREFALVSRASLAANGGWL